MKVSVIVPNYNHSSFLEKRLESIYNQTFKDFEVILLDDNSSDNSIDILQKYAHRHETRCIITNDKNSGSPFLQWKKGMEIAEGEYIWIAESDDWAESNFLKETVKVLEGNKDLALVYCQSLKVDEKGRVLGSLLKNTSLFMPNNWYDSFIKKGNDIIKYMIYRNVIPNASAVVFRNNSSIMSYLQVDLKTCGDWWFWINLIKGKKVAFINNHLNYFRFHSTVTRIRKTFDKRKSLLIEKMAILNLIEKIYPEYNFFINEYKKVIFKTILFTFNPRKIDQIQKIYSEEIKKELTTLRYFFLEILKRTELVTSFFNRAVIYLKNQIIHTI